MSPPFRWNLARREQLGRLVEGAPAVAYDEIVDDIRACAARVLAFSRDSDLLFLGRSPDSIFDYLSGALRGTSWESRLALVNLSLRNQDLKTVRREYPERLKAFHDHLAALRLTPSDLVRRKPVAFVDLVASGATFEHVTEAIRAWTIERGEDEGAILRKIRFLGITWRTKTSPNTSRWQQKAPWLSDFPADAVKNVSIPGRLWDYLGNKQPKVSLSNPPWRWGELETLEPPHHQANLEALRFAVRIYDLGASDEERSKLIAQLTPMVEMRHAWLRALVLDLKRGAA